MLDSAEAWIQRLGLKPLPREGGFFRETYRSDESLDKGALPARYASPRALLSAIYYLLTPQAFSALHRLRSDECWYFHAGDPVTMLQLFETGTAREVKLHNSGAPGVEPQVFVPRRVWQGARLDPGGRFALLSCSVAPAFDPADFELGDREKLALAYPTYRNRIHVFCTATGVSRFHAATSPSSRRFSAIWWRRLGRRIRRKYSWPILRRQAVSMSLKLTCRLWRYQGLLAWAQARSFVGFP